MTRRSSIPAAVKLLSAWVPVVILAVSLGIYHKFFYTEKVQTPEALGYRFEAEVRDDGAVHFTVAGTPDAKDTPDTPDITVGDDFWIYEDDTLEFGGEEYVCSYVKKTKYSSRYSADGFVTFPNGMEFQFYLSDAGEPVWNGSPFYDGASETFGEDWTSRFFMEPLPEYPSDMIAAAVISRREVEYNMERPYVWRWELTAAGLLLTFFAGVWIFCIRFSDKTAGARLRLFYKISGKVTIRPWVVAVWKTMCVGYFIVGVVFICWSYFMRE